MRFKIFTDKQDIFIRKNYKKYTIKKLTVIFNNNFKSCFKESQVTSYIKNHKIKSGRASCFPKGHTPWNINTKGVMKPNSGSFKKGSTPPNQRPVGSERICSKDGFILIKVNEFNKNTGFATKFKHKHVVNYEKESGPVPNGFVVAFKDSDKLNCEPDNLMLISRAELLRLNNNGYKKMPVELKPSVLAMSKLQVKISEKEKII